MMEGGDVNELHWLYFADQHAVLVNSNGGFYQRGKSYGMETNMALEMRRVVANFLSSPEGTLYVNNRPRKRIVRCRVLLQSAAKNEGLSAEEYLAKLR